MTHLTKNTVRPVYFTLSAVALAALLAPFAPAWVAHAESDSSGDARSGDVEARLCEPRFVSANEPVSLVTRDAIPAAKEHALAERVSAALRGDRKAKTMPRPERRPKVAASERKPAWACGAWEELWQGRGNARSCEWR